MVVVIASLAAWVFSPKGENQTWAHPLLCFKEMDDHGSISYLDVKTGWYDWLNRLWRSSLILAFAACYLMWGMSKLSFTICLLWTWRGKKIWLTRSIANVVISYSNHVTLAATSSHRPDEIGYQTWSGTALIEAIDLINWIIDCACNAYFLLCML